MIGKTVEIKLLFFLGNDTLKKDVLYETPYFI